MKDHAEEVELGLLDVGSSESAEALILSVLGAIVGEEDVVALAVVVAAENKDIFNSEASEWSYELCQLTTTSGYGRRRREEIWMRDSIIRWWIG